MAASLRYSGLAGVYDASIPPPRSDLAASLLDSRQHAPVVGDGPLAVATTRAASGLDGVVCILSGLVTNADALASRVGVAPDADAAEILAAAYRREGADILAATAGSFVVVLWDERTRTGVVAQDRLGTRSLYYAERGSRLYFASDVFPILRLLPSRPAPERRAVVRLLAGMMPPTELTPYEGLVRLTSGHLLELADGRWKRRRYWAPRYRRPGVRTATEAQEALWAAVKKSVAARTEGVGRVGIIMSGGLDSTTVAAAVAETRGVDTVRGYSSVFPSLPGVDESARIDRLVGSLGLESVQVEPQPQGIVRLALEYLAQWQLPLTGAGYLLERPLVEAAARDGVEVLLDGQGGDEVFGLAMYLPADRIRRLRLVSSVRLARGFPLALYPAPWWQTYHIWRLFALKPAMPYRLHASLRSRRGAERLAPTHFSAEAASLLTTVHDPWEWQRAPRRGAPLWWAFKAYLMTRIWEEVRLPEYLRHRAVMGGLEARPPLMDVDLVELALSIRPELVFDARRDRPLIRDALAGRVPDDVRGAREKSNLAPFYHGCGTGKDLVAIRALLLDPDARTRAFTNAEAVSALVEAPPPVGGPGWMQWFPKVWGLFVVEAFLRFQEDTSFAEGLDTAPVLTRHVTADLPPLLDGRPARTHTQHSG